MVPIAFHGRTVNRVARPYEGTVVEPTAPDEAFMTQLRQRLKPEVVALSEYLDRDLVSLWGYDKLG